MRLPPGSRLGVYEIVSPLGAGGMGEVYRARDTTLNRQVALKLLPDVFAHDEQRVARFTREAQALAALNHPHIAQIYGIVGEPTATAPNHVHALVMELVEGEDLAAVISRGPIAPADALPIAKQVAEALEAAHEQGIIHRDLKPANIRVKPDGTAKVLDFGLAKAAEPGVASASDASNSPTMLVQNTLAGVILGTAAYMAPEQARGKAVDRRADIWAFGAVLYEMLAGRRAFDGEGATDTVLAVVTREPDWSALPAATPARVRELIARCLAKDPKQRWHDIADVRLEIEQALDAKAAERSVGPFAPSGGAARTVRHPRQLAPWAIAAAALVVAGFAIAGLRRDAKTPAMSVTRLSVGLPGGLQLLSMPPAVSPDGRRLAFSALGPSGVKIYVLDLDSFDPREIAGSEGGQDPFFSPDGQWLGFTTGTLVKKAPAEGGEAVTLERPPFWVSGATWSTDGRIVISGVDRGLWALSADPGPASGATELTRVDSAAGERAHRGPVALPGGRLLYTVVRNGENVVGVYDPRTRRTRSVGEGGSPVAYLPSGQVVLRKAGRLVAVRFDLSRLEFTGPAAPVLADASPDEVGFSSAGVVAYLHYAEGARRDLVLVDRTGARQTLVQEAADYRWPRLSPDGRRLAVGVRMVGQSRFAASGLWVFDLETGTHIRLQDDGTDTEPVWTPDGRRIIYSSNRGSKAGVHLYWQPSDGSGTSELLSSLPFEQWPTDVSPDGRLLAFYGQPKGQGYGVWTVSMQGDHASRQVLPSTGFVRGARFSPDGKWLAYASDETGRFEVYVRPFPSLDAKFAVSADGGTTPSWSPDGRELFYRSGARMMAADVRTSPSFSVGRPRVLFEGPFDVDPSGDIDYDVAPDGRHFVMMLVDRAAQPTLRVLTRWEAGGSR